MCRNPQQNTSKQSTTYKKDYTPWLYGNASLVSNKKSINIIHYIKSIKDKNYMIILTAKKKYFTKTNIHDKKYSTH